MSFYDIGHVAISWGLLVLIWLVQIIIYPGFSRITQARFTDYHRWYAVRIGIFVVPLMLSEVIALAAWCWSGRDPLLWSIAAAAVAVVWLSTVALQVPIHRRLQHGKDGALIRRLVATNWIRTVAWSIKALVVTRAAF
jgi:hypothetical protein